MNARRIALSMAAVLVALALTLPAGGQSDGIIIDHADATTTLAFAGSAELATLIAGVEPRFAVWYANNICYYDITPVPSELETRLERVADRFIIWYADSNRVYAFAYPIGLVGDTIPPQISDITVSPADSGNAIIAWATDEFATSTILYGTQSGVYPQTVSDPLYTKQHEIPLTGLTPGTTYYYKVRSTDRSGNTATSSEHSFTAQLYVYLPLVMQNN